MALGYTLQGYKVLLLLK